MDPFSNQEDNRVIDPSTLVKNLKSNKVEIRERLFVDKPVHKQLEITMEERQGITQVSQFKKQATWNMDGYQHQVTKLGDAKQRGAQTYMN